MNDNNKEKEYKEETELIKQEEYIDFYKNTPKNEQSEAENLENDLIFPKSKTSADFMPGKEEKNENNQPQNKNKKLVGKSKPRLEKKCFIEMASKEKDQMAMEVRSIYKSEYLMTNNIKSLQKERKINDTIVALMSFIMIILCFSQLYILIDSQYQITDIILTLRTCILILSIPNCKIKK